MTRRVPRRLRARHPAIVVTAVACAVSILFTSASSGASTPSSLRIRIFLPQTRAVAGPPIKGAALITNTTSKRITVEACAADGWLDVGLANKTITYDPITSTVACAPSVHLAPGPNLIPIEVLTVFQSCVQPGGGPTTVDNPPCTRTGPPPLPAGQYSTKVFTFGLPAGTPPPPPVSVTLLSPNG